MLELLILNGMATYKVLQDIEAEDKFIGPLTLKQFIYAGITVVCLYLSFFLLTKHAGFMLFILLPPALIAGFLAWPWSRDQPTEVWLLAKIRFMLKPRRRMWDQDGTQELVTITAPKKIEQPLTDNLSQTEVKSRLRALAETIDSRGWAVKNINVNLVSDSGYGNRAGSSDRLIDLSEFPKEVSNVDVAAADDILDPKNNPVAQHLDQMISVSTQEHRQNIMDRVEKLRTSPAKTTKVDKPSGGRQDLWFMQDQTTAPGYSHFGSQTVAPGTSQSGDGLTKQEEQALLGQLHPDKAKPQAAYGHMKVIDPKGTAAPKPVSELPQVIPTSDPTIVDLAGNNDLNIATIARQAHKTSRQLPDDEVEVPLR